MKKTFFGSYLNVLLFITVTAIVLVVSFTLITGMSPLEALNISPLAASVLFSGLILTFIVLPIVVNRLRERSENGPR